MTRDAGAGRNALVFMKVRYARGSQLPQVAQCRAQCAVYPPNMELQWIALAVLASLAASIHPASPAALTGAWTPCPKADPNINECMKNSLQKFIPVLSKGIPKINVQTLDPLVLEKLDLSSPNLRMVYKDSKLVNLLNSASVTKVDADVNAYTLRVVLESPEVISQGHYEVDGKIMVMAVKGEGTFEFVYKNVTLDTTFIGKAKTKDGKPYLDLVDVKCEMTPQEMLIRADNLFNGNKELGDAFNKFANENWKVIYDDVKKELWTKLSGLFLVLMKPLFDAVPYDEIYTM